MYKVTSILLLLCYPTQSLISETLRWIPIMSDDPKDGHHYVQVQDDVEGIPFPTILPLRKCSLIHVFAYHSTRLLVRYNDRQSTLTTILLK